MQDIFYRLDCKDEPNWLEQRKYGIGGSSCSAILGQNPYMTNVEYYREKVGLPVKNKNKNNDDVLRYGTIAEDYIRGMFILDYEHDLLVTHQSYVILIRKDKPYIRSSLDGEILVLRDCIIDGHELKKGMRGILEIKTYDISRATRRLKWTETDIPDNYHCQRIHYLMGTGYDFHILRVDFKKYDFVSNKYLHSTNDYCITRDEVIEDINYLEEHETDFWLNHVEKKEEPNLILMDI